MDAAVSELFKIPDVCPICSAPTVVEGQFLYCRSRNCPVQLTGSVKVWVKRLGLLQWGDALIESLTNPSNPAINSLADLYRLEPEDIVPHCSGMKVARKCYEVMQASKCVTLDLLLASLNIPNLATSTAADIVSAGYNNIDKILALTVEQLLGVPNIGEITAGQVYEGIQSRRDAILDLATVLTIKDSSAGPLAGSSFCITGATSIPRKALEKKIIEQGGSVKSSVGAGTSYLVTNDPDTGSSKLRNAAKFGTKIITEAALHQMMRS